MLLEIPQLDKAGIIADADQYNLLPQAFSEANNIVFKNGALESAKGHVPFDVSFLEEQDSILSTTGIADKLYIFTTTQLYIMNQNSIEKITYPTGFTVSEEFYVNSLSNLPVIVSNKKPYGITFNSESGTNEITLLAGWGENMQCKGITAYKGYLFAYGVTYNSQVLEDLTWWSDVSAPDTYPTDWGFVKDAEGNVDLTKPIEGSLGGYNQLNSVGGSLVAARELAGSLYLFTESEIFRVTEISSDLLFSFNKVLEGKGAVSPSSVVPVQNGLACIGNGDIYLFNGSSAQTISGGRINSLVSEKLLSGVDIKMIRDYNEQQLYIFFRSAARAITTYTQAIVWDWESNTFSFRDFAYTQFEDITEYRADALFDDANKQWKDENIPWEQATYSWQSELKYGTGVLAVRAKQMLVLNKGYNLVNPDNTSTPISWNLKREYYPIVFGQEENTILRLNTVIFKGNTYSNMNVNVNNKPSNPRGDSRFIRVTDKVFNMNFYGKGFIKIPAIVLDWAIIGRR